MRPTHVYRPPTPYRAPQVYLHRTIEPYTQRWLYARTTQQVIVLSQPGGGWDAESVPFGQAPAVVTGDILIGPLLSPSAYAVTLNADGIFSVDTAGDTSRQLLNFDIYDTSQAQFYGSATFAINDLPPVFSGSPVYVFPQNSAITPTDLAPLFDDPEDDPISVLTLSAPAGAVVSPSSLVPGLLITTATMTGTLTAKAITTVNIRGVDPYNAGADGVITVIVGTITVPNVALLASADAQTTITAVYLNVSVVEDTFESVPFGQVAQQIPPAGTEVSAFSTVTIVVSIGQSTLAVPNLVGLTQAAAVSALLALGLTANIEVGYDIAAIGTVFSQYPPVGANVDAGALITIVISLGVQTPANNVVALIRFETTEDVIRFAA